MKRKLFITCLAIISIIGQIAAQQTGDVVTIGAKKYQLTGANLISNPGFDNGLTGWTDGTGAELTSAAFTVEPTGGVNNSPYLSAIGDGGIGSANSLCTGWSIASGKTYYFSYYVKHKSADAAAETQTYLKVSLDNNLINSNDSPVKALDGSYVAAGGEWTKNEAAFTNSTPYALVIARFRWLASKYAFDSFSLFEATEVANPAALQAVIDEAESIYNAGKLGAVELLAAINTAKSFLTSASIPDVEQALANLKVAITNYRLINASAITPLDATYLIANPSFEVNGFDGWVNNGMAAQTNASFSLKEGTTYLEKWVNNVEGTNVPDVGVSQTLVDIPNGSYTLTVGAQNIRQPDTPQYGGFIFADSKTAEVATEADYSMDFIVMTGTVTIGFKTEGSSANWVACDNFRLSYKGIDLTAMKEELSTRISVANALVSEKKQGSVATALSAAISAAQHEVDNSTTVGVLAEVAEQLEAAITAAQSSVAAYASLISAINTANTNKTGYAAWSGYSAFVTAIAAAQTVYNTATADETAIETAVNTLKTAELTCRWTQPAPMDATFVIVNPSFADNTAEGWTGPGAVNYHEMEFYQKTFDTYQTLTGLPAGKYTLKAQGFERPKNNDSGADYSDETEVISAKLYAKSSLGESAAPFQSLYSVRYEGSLDGSNVNNGYANSMAAVEELMIGGAYEITLNNVIVGGDGVLQLGAKSDYQQGGYWALFSNFRLTFEGADLAALVAALQTQIDAAKVLQNRKIQLALKTELNSAISAAEAIVAAVGSTTAIAITDAATRLVAAVAAVNPSLEAYVSLLTAIETANAAKEAFSHLPGKATFEAAIATANGIYDAAEADEAAIAAAIKALRQANVAFQLSADAPCIATVAIANPDFEESYTVFANPSSDRAIYQPSGWTAEWEGDTNDMTYNAESYTQDAVLWESSWGEEQAYFTRQRWSGSGSYIGLSQELPILPTGDYTLQFYAAAFGTNGDASGNAKGYVTVGATPNEVSIAVNASDPGTWAIYKVDFTVRQASPVTIGFRSTKLGDNFKTAYDHFTLLYTNKVAYGIEEVSTNEVPVSVEYYTLTGVKVAKPAAFGVYIVRKIYTSKAVQIEKIIYKK
ncbi:MAG: hypothetical protein EZS26_000946 [Candidatus Ordinivivax streblomastigis]|uniref:CBM-cenC domain-containing protein n=1 Tax=Candidatus Ordinivivax streblomastigis TaxID=2540710 RepID=A0A5M8P372_9BACT|nr:MAG: hypothetical protein EZS26_000946 [Candidatus Ordinivivax streblomastigis]